MDAAGLHPIRVYIKRGQKTIADRVACLAIYSICTEEDWMPGKIHMVSRWDQDAVN